MRIKLILLSASLLVLAACQSENGNIEKPRSAKSASSKAMKPPKSRDACEAIGGIAQSVMEKRQQGVAPSALRNAVRGDAYEQLAVALINKAYSQQRYFSYEMQARAVQDFRADAETTCYSR